MGRVWCRDYKKAIKSTRKRPVQGKTFGCALVNIDKLIGPDQEISFIAKDASCKKRKNFECNANDHKANYCRV